MSAMALIPARSLAAFVPPLLLLLAGCATPEARLHRGLVNAGVDEPMAGCLASHMASRLSVDQLRKLRALARARDFDPQRTSYEELMHGIRALGDPEILRVTAGAAVRCTLG